MTEPEPLSAVAEAAIRTREEAATKGPWMRKAELASHIVYVNHTSPKDTTTFSALWNAEWATEADGVFTAHAREDVPALLAELDRVRAEGKSSHDRGAVLREAIDVAREEGHRLEESAGIERARGARSVAYLLRRLLVKEQPAQQAMPHGERRERFARVIYERWNPGHQWADAHPDDVTAYGADADAAMAAADSVAGIPYATPTRTDTYREIADRLTALGTRPDRGWATTAASKVRAWADEERDEQEAQAHLDQLADELPAQPCHAHCRTRCSQACPAPQAEGMCRWPIACDGPGCPGCLPMPIGVKCTCPAGGPDA